MEPEHTVNWFFSRDNLHAANGKILSLIDRMGLPDIYRRSPENIRPSGYIDTKLIEDNWDDILRFIATIRLREKTASYSFRRLNSYSKQHALYQVLKALG